MRKIFYGLAIFFGILLAGSFSIQGIYGASEGVSIESVNSVKTLYFAKLVSMINEEIQSLSDDVFSDSTKKEKFKEILVSGDDNIYDLFIKSNFFYFDPKENINNFYEATTKLSELKTRMGSSLGGNSADDWITDQNSQQAILEKIDFALNEYRESVGGNIESKSIEDYDVSWWNSIRIYQKNAELRQAYLCYSESWKESPHSNGISLNSHECVKFLSENPPMMNEFLKFIDLEVIINPTFISDSKAQPFKVELTLFDTISKEQLKVDAEYRLEIWKNNEILANQIFLVSQFEEFVMFVYPTYNCSKERLIDCTTFSASEHHTFPFAFSVGTPQIFEGPIFNEPGDYNFKIWLEILYPKVLLKEPLFFEKTITILQEHVSPKKQIEKGIELEDVTCKEDLQLIFKYDGSPACVKSDTKSKLIQRGWAIS